MLLAAHCGLLRCDCAQFGGLRTSIAAMGGTKGKYHLFLLKRFETANSDVSC